MAGWLRGVVSEVPSGDTVIITAGAKPGAIPASKRLTLASLIAPKLVSAMAIIPGHLRKHVAAGAVHRSARA